MFYFQNAVLNENKGFTIYLQCLCPLGFKMHTDFFHCSEQCSRENCPLVQFLNISKVKLKERAPKPHSPTFGCIPTLTLSSGTYQTPMSQSRSSAAKLLTQKGFFFPLLAQQFPVLVQLLVLVKMRGQENTSGLEECRRSFFFKRFDISRSGVRTIITNQEKIQGVGVGEIVKTKSMQVMEEIHVEPQQVLETTPVLLGDQSKQLKLHL